MHLYLVRREQAAPGGRHIVHHARVWAASEADALWLAPQLLSYRWEWLDAYDMSENSYPPEYSIDAEVQI